MTIYKVGNDSGYSRGTNYWGDKGFAERYVVNDSLSSVEVIGVYALFTGRVNSSTTKKINFDIWNEGPRQIISGTRFYSGFPNNVLDSLAVPVNQLGIGATGDTIKSHFFAVSKGVTGTFFTGYTINYNFATLSGDTLGLYTSKDGERASNSYFSWELHVSDIGDTVLDTIINVQNATLQSDNKWHDNYTDNDSLKNNLAIYPIVTMGFPASVKGITRNNLTFYGNFPNPAIANANIRFALTGTADVTVQVMDIHGRIVATIQQANLSTGDHVVTVNTSAFPAGDYLYLVRTSDGDGIAGKIVHP
jgi:hypothetical protein